jgi:redox-sensitive bicupin YhaK (pirin superfamily)
MPFSRRRLLSIGAASVVAVGASAAIITSRKARSVRVLERVVFGTAHEDGAGVKLSKLLGGRALPLLDPFLMLDRFHSSTPSDYQAGFPNHPHRGFETVTIMIDGAIRHQDSVGNDGRIEGGGVQWMTAGRGIIHAEMPEASPTTQDMWGYQLWVNLPAREKWRDPRYQDLDASAFSTTAVQDGDARMLAGRVGGVRGAIDGVSTQPLLMDLRVPAGGRARFDVPAEHTAFLQMVHGDVIVGADGRALRAGALGVLGRGDTIDVRADGANEARLLVFAAAPIGEPVARRGPFVMNTEAEIQQAWDDYRSGRLLQRRG